MSSANLLLCMLSYKVPKTLSNQYTRLYINSGLQMEQGINETCPYKSMTFATVSAFVYLSYSSNGFSYLTNYCAELTRKYSSSRPLLGLDCELRITSTLFRMFMWGISRFIMVDNDIMHREINWLMSCMQVQSKSYNMQGEVPDSSVIILLIFYMILRTESVLMYN